VLVVGHQDHAVGRAPIAFERLRIEVHRQCLRGGAAEPVELEVHEVHERRHVVVQVGRNVLEVDGDARQVVAPDHVHQLRDHALPGGAGAEQPPEAARVEVGPLGVVVAHHREHLRPPPLGLLLGRVEHPAVHREPERVAARHDERPLADHPVQILDVAAERGERIVVPVDVEPGRDRRGGGGQTLGLDPGARRHGKRRGVDRERLGAAAAEGEKEPAPGGDALARPARRGQGGGAPAGGGEGADVAAPAGEQRRDENARDHDEAEQRREHAETQRDAADAAPPCACRIEKDAAARRRGGQARYPWPSPAATVVSSTTGCRGPWSASVTIRLCSAACAAGYPSAGLARSGRPV